MAFIDCVYRFAVSPAGRTLDRQSVRWLGLSPLGMFFARHRRVAYNPHVLLTTLGRRTGRRRTVVLPCFRCLAPDENIVVVGSRGGAASDPQWVHNLRAEPACWVRERRVLRRARARIAAGSERAELWRSITERAPVYLQYQARAKGIREIPVIVLEGEVARSESTREPPGA